MKNKSHLAIMVVFSVILYSCTQEVKVHKNSFTAINPLSYTDVVFRSDRDTVLVSTFSGRIAERIKGQSAERLLINLKDEIYSLAYDKKSHRIYASTLHSGIAVIDADKKTVIDYLVVKGSWISKIFLSENGDLLAGHSENRQNHIWDVKNNAPVTFPENLANYRIAGIDESGDILFKGNGKFVFWNPRSNVIRKELTLSGNLKDIDASGNMLLFLGKDFQFYSVNADSVSFRKNHRDWPYYLKEQDTVVRIPLQLDLTAGQLTDEYIYTAGIDRSVRKWSNTDGRHIEDIIEHKATISAMDSSPDQSQIVSVDLKGGILFSEVQ